MISIASAVYMILSIMFFLKLLNIGSESSRYDLPAIWFNVGTLLYFSATFTLFVVVDKIVAGKSIEDQSNILIAAWVLNAVFYGVFNVCNSIALCLKPKV